MKTRNIKKGLGLILSLFVLHSSYFMLTSCEDMMTVETGDKTYVNANDTLYSYLGIVRAMQDVAERQVILGEIRGDLVSSTDYTTDTLFAISNFDDPQDQSCSMLKISDYYNVINNCNFYIANADTSAIKSNVKYMIPEYAQVKAIRAWAYLQLVKNYKEVPFITKPVKNLGVITNFDYANNLVNKDNLIDRLIEDGILQYLDTRYPQYGNPSNTYGSWNNGYTEINAHLCFIPLRLVLADLYLLRGNGQGDYTKAAQLYYDWLKNETTPMPIQGMAVIESRSGNNSYGSFYSAGAGNFGTFASTYSYSENNEVISLIPGSANAGLGKMLTRVSDIYGYTTTSSQRADEVTVKDADGNDQGTGEYESSGAISVNKNYERQYAPSPAYSAVNDNQTYVSYTVSGTTTTPSYIYNIDGRYYTSVENYSYEGEGYPLCSKAARGNAFYYTIPIYRKTLVWLRLAEAINRAGYPEFAFAILKDGLNQYTLPFLGNRYEPVYDEKSGYRIIENKKDDITIYKDEAAEEPTYYIYDEEGTLVPYTETVSGSKWEEKNDTIAEDSIYFNSYGAMYYVTDKDLLTNFKLMFNFEDEVWNSTYGVHARGCGYLQNYQRTATYWTSSNPGESSTSISGYRDSIYYDYSKLIMKQGVDIASASREDIINAVENIIVDELALETAFEGNRFTDLVRIAEHKNASGFSGTDWLARKIANRNYRPATSKTPETGQFDDVIYNKLKNQTNWYFTLPAWNVK